MPIYEYKCPECGKTYTKKSNKDIPFCVGVYGADGPPDEVHSKTTTKRVWNIGGISFKGKGFYKNDSQ